ncbi:hypothetical protein POM88_044629 [Heracleum sosnowskyi]|uniref:DUF4283 domain-containing protein n=1 Tax=Heracleum sosnowskyi TaxID=360622 RepID=A0AAD8H350_9APIA|nr:hypothetical protein POM88_044629 [Heracleum sosnowskyi]
MVADFAHRIWRSRGLVNVFQKDTNIFVFEFNSEISMNFVLSSCTWYVEREPWWYVLGEFVKFVGLWVRAKHIWVIKVKVNEKVDGGILGLNDSSVTVIAWTEELKNNDDVLRTREDTKNTQEDVIDNHVDELQPEGLHDGNHSTLGMDKKMVAGQFVNNTTYLWLMR